jgi:hypothetical protein
MKIDLTKFVAGGSATLLALGAVALLPDGSRPAARPLPPARTTSVDGPSYVDGTAEATKLLARRHGQARVKVNARGAGADGSAVGHKGISFAPPIDFATGASPSAEVYNKAAGDQLDTLPQHNMFTDSVAVGDFDHDGVDDVAQTNVLASTVSVFLGAQAGGFGAPEQYDVSAQPNFVMAGQLDLDPHLDLAVANFASHTVTILRGDGRGGFGSASTLAVPSPRNVSAGDFNNDAVPDLAVASGSIGRAGSPPAAPSGGVFIFTGSSAEDGSVTFAVSQLVTHPRSGGTAPMGANYVAVGDYDGDHFDDLAIAVGTSLSAGDSQAGSDEPTGDDVLIFLNTGADGAPAFASSPSQDPIRVGAQPDAIGVADLNRDGHLDLAVIGGAAGDITTIAGASDGYFRRLQRSVTAGGQPRSVAAADFDRDGITDIVTASFGSSTVSVFRGKGDGTVEPGVDFWAGDSSTSVAVGDFGGDEEIDLAVGRLRTDKLSVLVNAPGKGDGVSITRDVLYTSTPDPVVAFHNTLDVYVPPPGTRSFAGAGKPYPVVLFAHGGGGATCAKNMVGYLMRSLARRGIVAVTMNYRLGTPVADAPKQIENYASAVEWVHANIGGPRFGGDPDTIFASGTSSGGILALAFGTDDAYATKRAMIAGIAITGQPVPWPSTKLADAKSLPPMLLLFGDEGGDLRNFPPAAAYAQAVEQLGGSARALSIPGRDHLSLVSNLAVDGDLGRTALLDFIRSRLR